MRMVALIVAAAACVGAAFAQEGAAASLVVFEAEYDTERARARNVARIVPRQMLERGQSGVAHLCCVPRENRSLDCRVALEWPSGGGFGDTALRFAERLRLTPASYEQFEAEPNGVIHAPIEFRMLPVRPALDATLQEIAERSQNLCGVASEPAAPFLISVSGGARSLR